MSDIAVRVEGLSKRYFIGGKQEAYRTFRDSIADALMSPVRRVANVVRGRSDSASGLNEAMWALKDVSFDVKRGEVVGIIGRNGAGKSTLLKILSRITEPTEGCVKINGRVGALLEVGTGFHPELTGRENIYLNAAILGMKRHEIDRKFDEIVAFAEIEKFIDTPVKHYSSGMGLRLGFAVAAHLDPEILIVDEVLAVGDIAFQRKCMGKMGSVAGEGKTVLFVSHNLDAVMNLCSRCLVLSNGQCMFDGQTAPAISTYSKLGENHVHSPDSHILYEGESDASDANYSITRIELLDFDRKAVRLIQTWDDIVFRVYYSSPEPVEYGSLILDMVDYKDQRLSVFDSGFHVPIRAGKHWVDCAIQCFPFSAGEYFLSAGMSLSNSQWLWRKQRLASFRVYGRDVFRINRPPTSSRMIYAIPHEWKYDRQVDSGPHQDSENA